METIVRGRLNSRDFYLAGRTRMHQLKRISAKQTAGAQMSLAQFLSEGTDDSLSLDTVSITDSPQLSALSSSTEGAPGNSSPRPPVPAKKPQLFIQVSTNPSSCFVRHDQSF